jgi:hypothetical protein
MAHHKPSAKEMKTVVLVVLTVVGGIVVPACATTSEPAPTPSSGPTGFFVDPAFPHGDAVMTLMRRLFPKTKYISLTRVTLTQDATHDFAEFFVGRGIDHSFESVYYRHFIFAKKKTEDWSKARVFDKGFLGYKPFSGPIELLEAKGWENGKPKPSQLIEPTPKS